ncbi:hypothetical protein, partial [Janthinobacterium fluminis]
PPAPSSNAHIYRLLIFKELVLCCCGLATKRFVCQPRRRKSMKRFACFVNFYFYCPVVSDRPLIGEANYSKALVVLARFS